MSKLRLRYHLKDRTIIILLILIAPAAFILSFAIGTFLRYPRAEPFYFLMTFMLTYYLLVMLGIFVENWLSKGGTVVKYLKKTFSLRKLEIKTTGLREFFHNDFTIPERLNILSFLVALVISLGVWFFLGMIESMLSRRVLFTVGAFLGSAFGMWLLTADISIRYYKEARKQKTGITKELDLESSRIHEFSFEDVQNLDELQRISLGSNELRKIDLTPLAGNTNLKELILYMNHLESIDLSPLASCPNLEYLDLTCNDLETIDLAPLSSCLKLSGLNIGANKTSELDLSPISECKEMEVLNIDGMNLREIDLSPLRGFTKLWFLKLDENEFTSLDITPLFECTSLTNLQIDNIELTTTIILPIEDWPEGVRKHKKRFRREERQIS